MQDRVYIEVTKGDLDLLMESVLRSCYSWRLAHAAMDRGEQAEVGTEECQTACEAERMLRAYQSLHDALGVRAQELGFNVIELLASDTVGFANQTLELLKVKK